MAQYRPGTIGCEPAMGAETDLVNVQVDATEKSEERVALLTETLKRQRHSLKMTEHADTAGGLASRCRVVAVDLLVHPDQVID